MLISRGIFLKPIAAELGASRTDLSLGFTITTVVAALESPLVGYLLAAALFGFGYGAMNPLRNGITAMIFGGASFGSVAGDLRPMMLPLGVIGLLHSSGRGN